MAVSKQEVADFRAFVQEFQNESDRAAVILGAAKLDLLLFQILQKVLKPCASKTDELLDGDVPLGTFSARISMCYRLGLIDEEMTRAIGIIRRIRNSFAHELSGASLGAGAHKDRVRELVASLRTHGSFQWLITDYFGGNVTSASEFRAAVALMALRLEGLFESRTAIFFQEPISIIPHAWDSLADSKSKTELAPKASDKTDEGQV